MQVGDLLLDAGSLVPDVVQAELEGAATGRAEGMRPAMSEPGQTG